MRSNFKFYLIHSASHAKKTNKHRLMILGLQYLIDTVSFLFYSTLPQSNFSKVQQMSAQRKSLSSKSQCQEKILLFHFQQCIKMCSLEKEVSPSVHSRENGVWVKVTHLLHKSCHCKAKWHDRLLFSFTLEKMIFLVQGMQEGWNLDSGLVLPYHTKSSKLAFFRIE